MTRSMLIDTTRQAKGETLLYHAGCAKKLHPSEQGRLAPYTGSTRRLHCGFCGKPIREPDEFPSYTHPSGAEPPSGASACDPPELRDLPDLPPTPKGDETIVMLHKRKKNP